MNAEKRRQLGGVCSYSTKQIILHWEQHEYGNHATDALCWTTKICKLFYLSFWCISSPFSNGLVLNRSERSCGVDLCYGCCRHMVSACRMRWHGQPLRSGRDAGFCFQTLLWQAKAASPSQTLKSNTMEIGTVFLSFCYSEFIIYCFGFLRATSAI